MLKYFNNKPLNWPLTFYMFNKVTNHIKLEAIAYDLRKMIIKVSYQAKAHPIINDVCIYTPKSLKNAY